jgi:hypothetical protein
MHQLFVFPSKLSENLQNRNRTTGTVRFLTQNWNLPVLNESHCDRVNPQSANHCVRDAEILLRQSVKMTMPNWKISGVHVTDFDTLSSSSRNSGGSYR